MEVKKSKNYPDGVKYSFIIANPISNKKTLVDNHSPKNHHYHIDNEEFEYIFDDIDQLIKDFKSLVKNHMGVIL